MTRRLTMTRMAEYLNNKFTNKSTGKPFTPQDCQGYIDRGRIPYEYGGWKVTLDQGLLDSTGVKAYRLEKDLPV